MRDVPIIPMGDNPGSNEAAAEPLPRPWQTAPRLSSTGRGPIGPRFADAAEAFLDRAGFDRAPWLAVLFMGGILAWFALPGAWHWAGAVGGGAGLALGALALWPPGSAADERRTNLRQAVVVGGCVFALGIAAIWARSELVGAQPLARPGILRIDGHVLEREDQPSEGRLRLTLAAREAATDNAIKVRVNVPIDRLGPEGVPAGLAEGAEVRLRARLMPPASPMLPGSYDFARAAWFRGLAATGTMVGPLELVRPAPEASGLASLQRELAAHVRARVEGSAGTIAAAFASGDRGAIAREDDEAMRDSGLTHLLSISGLHVSALVAAAYFVALRLMALWPWLALRVRLPVAAAAAGALAGIGYTLLTGAEVPTIRSCIAALLVLGALVLGRDPLSLRMVAVAAGFVLLLWPESAINPGFQMSFASVLAIIALSTCGPVRAFLAPREEPWAVRTGRHTIMLLLTGFVIELTLMPIVMFHFHRAGFYGALANVIAIPLVTFIAMPAIALGLLFDLVGLGAPFWWVVQHALDLMLAIAHFTADQPGAVKLMPQISGLALGLFVSGGLWLGLWTGPARLAGLAPVAAASAIMAATPIPDLLVSGDGRQVGITTTGSDGTRRLIALRDTRSSYIRDNLLELAGVAGEPAAIASWPGARCSSAFCTLTIARGGRDWMILLGRNRVQVEERALAAACARSDIVIAERFLPRSCRPRWLKADRRMLEESGGLAVHLAQARIDRVADGQGDHGWWKGARPTPPRERAPPASTGCQ
jgi:competence protein ComEC